LISEKKIGAIFLKNGNCQFRVWAPSIDKLEINIVSPEKRIVPLERDIRGYYSVVLDSVRPGSSYYYRLNGESDYPDPASRYQPEGVHGPSQVINPDFPWEDKSWAGIPLEDYVIYELHAGSFTSEGAFQAIIPFLDELKTLGISAIEIMPVAQFPGERNWGYDGAFPFAVQNSYGGPDGLKELVNACHKKGLALILDVVYNHLGPEGNYFEKFGPYFTERYKTPWGKAINFDGAYSDEVRSFFIQNAVYWINEFHLDALRLDAIHAIKDTSAQPFLSELSMAIQSIRKRSNRYIFLIAESDANDRRIILPREDNGYGMDAQWNDDFHHALHAILTGEKSGYYQDFGQIADLAKAFREGFIYSGQYSRYRQRSHGSSTKGFPAKKFVIFIQNHDQVGNRMLGERLNRLVSFEKLKVAAGVVILSPFIPLIFMGEEYGEPATFQYFINHSDPSLVKAVRQGRRQEFASFGYRGKIPDPQAEQTFLDTKLDHTLRRRGQHGVLLKLYKELLRLRKETPALAVLSKDNMEVIGYEKTKLLFIRRWVEASQVIIIYNFNNRDSSMIFPVPAGKWEKRFDSEQKRWLGKSSQVVRVFLSDGEIKLTLAPNSFIVFSAGLNKALSMRLT
jgi:maltooligosyltrehalose trehalohydrolase